MNNLKMLALFPMLALLSLVGGPDVGRVNAQTVPQTTEQTPTSQPELRQDVLVLDDGAMVSGAHRARSIIIPEGCKITVTDDASFEASETIQISGSVVCADRPSSQYPIDGVRIELQAGIAIEIRGEVRGGAGGTVSGHTPDNSVGMYGGRGSDIAISSPVTLVFGQVEAGKGGMSGAHTKGANGGGILVFGQLLRGPNSAGYQLVGGMGGQGGPTVDGRKYPANGGDGGGVLIDSYAFCATGGGAVSSKIQGEEIGCTPATANSDEARMHSIGSVQPSTQDPIEPSHCEAGLPGAPGDNTLGGTGGTGSTGANGTSSSPAGGPGGVGGVGGGTLTAPAVGGTGNPGTKGA
jgi:hypothetical protein